MALVEAFRNNRFRIEVENIAGPELFRVNGLGLGDIEARDRHDGGSNVVQKLSSGIVRYDDITLERYMDGTSYDLYFKKWFEEVFNLDGKGTLLTGSSGFRRNGAIVVTSSGKDVVRFGFEGAWVKSMKFSDLDAGGNELLKQTVQLVVNRVAVELL